MVKPNPLYELVLQLREQNQVQNEVGVMENEVDDMVEDEKNEGSEGHEGRVVIDISDQDGARKFIRFYVCFAGIKRGWKQNCIKIIVLDGCWLKGKCKGELLSAIGRDANDQIFPICWVVVEGESYDSGSWFLKLLVLDLGPNRTISNGTC